MNNKARRLKRNIGGMKVTVITNIGLAISIWILVAYYWGKLEAFKEILPWNFVLGCFVGFVGLGIYLLVSGIETLKFTGKVAEVLKDIVPDEDDE